MKFKRTLGTILVALSLVGGCREKHVKYDYDAYRGQTGNYKVRIGEQRKDEKLYRRIVHLNALQEETVPHGITGHDYDSDDEWDRIFIMDEEFSGCNSVFFKKGKTIWEPCSADKGKVEPFTTEQINAARKMLDKAVKDVYNKGHKR